MDFQESLDFLKTQSKVKICIILLEILVNGNGLQDWGWFAAVGPPSEDRFDPTAVLTDEENDNDNGINHLDVRYGRTGI